jgi:uncharacterized RDD family membrane protein YckC
MDWYYLKDGRQLGPVGEGSIRAWLESGFLTSADLLWCSGMNDWAPVSELPEFGGGPAAGPSGTGPFAPAPGSIFGVTVPPPAGYAAYAGFWLRLGAYLIDSILLSSVVIVAWFPKLQKGMTPDALQSDPAFLAVELILPWLYFSLMECSPLQATLGKKAFRLKVTDLAGHRLSFLRASLRHWGKLLSGLTLLAGYVLAGFTARKQALHDLLASCLILRE